MDDGERRRLERTREVLLRRVAGIREFVRGSVVLMRRRCTYPGCRKCAAGERHPTWVLTVSERGKTRTVYLGKGRAAAARTMAANYRRLQEWLEAAARLNLELLTHAAPPTAKGVRDGSQESRTGRVSALGGKALRRDAGPGRAGDGGKL